MNHSEIMIGVDHHAGEECKCPEYHILKKLILDAVVEHEKIQATVGHLKHCHENANVLLVLLRRFAIIQSLWLFVSPDLSLLFELLGLRIAILEMRGF